jgi:outer membrane protein OmpA-like peptidoglycan-associated protein
MKMPDSVNEYYSGKLGHDFAPVRIYTGVNAETAADSIQARAFTYGNNVVFNRNEYSPGSKEGRRLLAHELAHVVQQNNTIGRVIQRAPQVVDCESRSRTNILQAEQVAVRWIDMAIRRLSSPSLISPELSFHFQVSPDQTDVLSSIASIFEDVKDHILREEFTYTCVPQSDSRCEDEIIGTISGFAYLDTRSIYFCGDVTASGESNLTRLLIHEAIHAKIGGLDDGPYISDPLYPGNDPLSNTDAYASFIGDIATSPVFGLPQELQEESAGNIPGSGYGSSGYPQQSRETELAGFPVNSAVLSQDAREYLDIFLEEWSDEFGTLPVIVRLAGHADRAESAGRFTAVSRARAVIVADYLMDNLERFGLFIPENVLIETFSATRPFTGSRSATGRALNRRVSIEIVRAP